MKKIDDDSSSKKLLNALNTNMNIISGLTEKLQSQLPPNMR